MCAPRWPLILWGLLSLLRPHLCAEKCHFLVNDTSDDGLHYMDDTNLTISFRLSDSCAGDVKHVTVGLVTDISLVPLCTYRRDGEQYVSVKKCGYDAGTGIFTVRASTEEVASHTLVNLWAYSRDWSFVKEFSMTVKESSQITNFTVEINGAVITAEDSNTLWVEENSTVTLGCEWSPGKPPQTAVLKRNQTALHPVKSSVLPREEVGEIAKRVEHTIVRFEEHDSGVYTCQRGVDEKTMWKDLQLRGSPNNHTSVVNYPGSPNNTPVVNYPGSPNHHTPVVTIVLWVETVTFVIIVIIIFIAIIHRYWKNRDNHADDRDYEVPVSTST